MTTTRDTHLLILFICFAVPFALPPSEKAAIISQHQHHVPSTQSSHGQYHTVPQEMKHD